MRSPAIKRTLVLRRETLVELTGAELVGIAGGALPTQVIRECLESYAPATLNVQECTQVPSGHTCIDCLTRYC